MKTRGRGATRPAQWVAGSLLMLSSTAAMALGLGQIQVKSGPGQPLLAEIPIISNVAGELDGASARLAPPEVFARVGLEPPRGIVGGLQFDIVPNAQGRMVVRVTSSEPVTAQALSFLVEVDWGKGRLVREYSALIDAPRTAAALAEPQIQAPDAAPSDLIERQPEVAGESLPPALAEQRPSAPAAAAPVARHASPARAARPASVPTAATQAEVAAAASWKVRQGQTLSQIARRLGDGEATLDQTMMALLQANPEAFIGGNINRLRAGAVLRVPGRDERVSRTASEASSLVREQIAQWRQAGAPVMQPAEPATAARTEKPAAPPRPATATAKASSTPARLEIAPAAARDGQKAGNQSGIAAGGKGDTLMNEQLRQAKEDVASRDAEIQELRSRVAELEKLQQDQQKLISLKDDALASAQKQLADAPAAAPAAPAVVRPTAVPAKAPAPAPAAAPEASGTPVWMWGGLGLVLLGLIGMWLRQRRRRREEEPRPRFDIDALAPAATGGAALHGATDDEPLHDVPADDAADVPEGAVPGDEADVFAPHDEVLAAVPETDLPEVHADDAEAAAHADEAAPQADGEHRFDWLADETVPAPDEAEPPEPLTDIVPEQEEPAVIPADASAAAVVVDETPAAFAADTQAPPAPSFDVSPGLADAAETEAAVAPHEDSAAVAEAVAAEPAPFDVAPAFELPAEPALSAEAAPSPGQAAAPALEPANPEPAPEPAQPAPAASASTPSVADEVAGSGDGLADRERLDLAIAYLDMGDTETAREMLEEALASRDPQVRGEAEQLLREIG